LTGRVFNKMHITSAWRWRKQLLLLLPLLPLPYRRLPRRWRWVGELLNQLGREIIRPVRGARLLLMEAHQWEDLPVVRIQFKL
jgi:hypothetical protein